MITISEPLPVKENTHSCHQCVFSLTGSGSDIVIILLTEDSSVYMFSFIGSGSDIIIIPLTETTSCKREHTQLSSVRGMITI
jgi:hypothetical protein